MIRASLLDRYDETIKEREKIKEKEDLSDMVAEHAAKKVINMYFLSVYDSVFSLKGSFSSKTRNSLKTQLLFYVLEHSNFLAVPFPESCSHTDQFPKNSLRPRIFIICECAHIAFCFPCRCPILCSAAFKSILFRLSVSE